MENSNADEGVLPGGDGEGAGRQRQSADQAVIPSETERAGQRPLHRSPRVQSTARPGGRK